LYDEDSSEREGEEAAESYSSADGKLRGEFQQRREMQDQLVNRMRRYGVALVAAAVFLPAQLVAVVAACLAIIWMGMRAWKQQQHSSGGGGGGSSRSGNGRMPPG
jgi:hypothetical protein